MAALISGDLNNTKDVVKYIAEAVRMGIKVLPCDINKSYIDFRMEDNSIRFGMGAVKDTESINLVHRRCGEFHSRLFKLKISCTAPVEQRKHLAHA